MKLSQDAIDEFKQIYKEEFNEEIPDAVAELMAEDLLEFYALLIPNQMTHGKSPNDQ